MSASLAFIDPNAGEITVTTPEGIVLVLLLGEIRELRKQLVASKKVGCRNFEMRDGRGHCRNCGYHNDEH